MIRLLNRILRQGLPWGVVILSIGLARQHAAGAGAFEPNGWLTQAQTALAQLSELLPQPPTTTADSSNVPAEVVLAPPAVEPRRPLATSPQFAPRRGGQYSCGPNHCRH